MNPKYLDILACPACKGRLSYDNKAQHLICTVEKTAYPIIDGIMMLERNYAIDLTAQVDQVFEPEQPHEK